MRSAPVAVTVHDDEAMAPGAPGLQAAAGNESATLDWTPPSDDGGAPVTGYEYDRDGGAAQAVGDDDAKTHTVDGLANGTDYTFRVRAVNRINSGAWSAAKTVTPVPRTLRLTPSALVVDEGTSGSYTVELTEAPTGTVTVTIAGHAGTDVTLSRNRLTFTTTNWDVPQTVSVTAREDGDAVDDTVTLTFTVSGGGYGGVTLPDLEVTVADNDGGIVAVPASLTVTEGGTGSYGLTLTRRPTSPVTVNVTAVGAVVTASPATLTFTADNFATAQTVTVTAAQDTDRKDAAVTLRHAATGGGYAVVAGDVRSAPVAVTVLDDEATAPGAPGLQAAAGNQSATLRWTPPGDDGGAPVTGYEYSLDGGAAQAAGGGDVRTHTVDGLANGTDYAFRVRAVNRIGRGEWSAAQTVRPVPRTLRLTPSALVVDEGTSGSYTVELTEAPTGTVRVTIDGASGTDVTLSRTRLAFTTTNWDVPQTVSVTAGEDGDAVDDTVTLTFTVSGGGYGGVTLPDLEVTVADNDGGIVAVPASLTVTEGGTGSYGLTLTRCPTSPVTVNVTAVGGGVTVNPATLTFTTSNWDTAQTVTVTGSQDTDKNDETVTLRHAATGGGYAVVAGDARSAPVAVTVLDDEATAPGAPGLQAAAGNQLAKLGWTPPDDDGGTQVTGYEYTRDGGATHAAAGGGDARSHTVRELENGAEYTFEVRAVNRIDPGAWSAAKTVTPVPLTLTVKAVNETVTEGEPVVYRIVMSNPTPWVTSDPSTATRASSCTQNYRAPFRGFVRAGTSCTGRSSARRWTTP